MGTPSIEPRSPGFRMRTYRGHLWLKYVSTAALISILVLGLACIALVQEKQRYEERATVATQNIVRLFDQQIRAVLDKIDLALLTTSDFYTDMLASGGLDPAKLNQHLYQQETLLPEIESLRIIDKKGIVRFGRGVSDVALTDQSDREYFRQARDSLLGRPIVSPPFFIRMTQKWVVVLARRLNAPDGSFAGVVYANLACEQFRNILSLASLGPNGAATVRMQDLSLVDRFPDPKNSVGGKDVSAKLRAIIEKSPDAGAYTAVTKLDGIERSNAFRRLRSYPLYVIVGLAKTDYLGGWHQYAFLVSGLTGLILLLTWLAILREYRNQSRLNEDIAKRIQMGSELEQSIHERTLLYNALERQKNELEKINASLEQKVAERTLALSKANRKLERLATHDPLTNLGNRRAADEHLHAEFLRMNRSGNVYSLLLLDIDHFKRVNDCFGHEQGDVVLKHIADILGHSCRATDFVARFGGEEFLVILPNTSHAQATVVAHKIRESIAASEFGPAGDVTVSIGVATASPHDPDDRYAIRVSDKNLYKAKTDGRNRVANEIPLCADDLMH